MQRLGVHFFRWIEPQQDERNDDGQYHPQRQGVEEPLEVGDAVVGVGVQEFHGKYVADGPCEHTDGTEVGGEGDADHDQLIVV